MAFLLVNPRYESKPCFDKHAKCSEWTEIGYCDIYSNFMYKKCPLSCEACYPGRTYFTIFHVSLISALVQLTKTSSEITVEFVSSLSCYFGFGTLLIWYHSISFLENRSAKVCKNEWDDANCQHWAGLGFCQRRPKIMIYKCQRACNSCPKGERIKIYSHMQSLLKFGLQLISQRFFVTMLLFHRE